MNKPTASTLGPGSWMGPSTASHPDDIDFFTSGLLSKSDKDRIIGVENVWGNVFFGTQAQLKHEAVEHPSKFRGGIISNVFTDMRWGHDNKCPKCGEMIEMTTPELADMLLKELLDGEPPRDESLRPPLSDRKRIALTWTAVTGWEPSDEVRNELENVVATTEINFVLLTPDAIERVHYVDPANLRPVMVLRPEALKGQKHYGLGPRRFPSVSYACGYLLFAHRYIAALDQTIGTPGMEAEKMIRQTLTDIYREGLMDRIAWRLPELISLLCQARDAPLIAASTNSRRGSETARIKQQARKRQVVAEIQAIFDALRGRHPDWPEKALRARGLVECHRQGIEKSDRQIDRYIENREVTLS